MRHLRTVTRNPAAAQDPTTGQILSFISTILTAVANAFVAKEEVTGTTGL